MARMSQLEGTSMTARLLSCQNHMTIQLSLFFLLGWRSIETLPSTDDGIKAAAVVWLAAISKMGMC